MVFVADDGRTELVASPAGSEGFAVTDIVASTDGSLLVSVGGRRSRGGIYRIDAAEPMAAPAKVKKLDWSQQELATSTPIARSLLRLRRQAIPVIDQNAAKDAVNVLESSEASRADVLAAIALLIESVGGLGPGDPKDARGKQQAAAVFDSCRGRIRPKIDAELKKTAVSALMSRLQSPTLGTTARIVIASLRSIMSRSAAN